MTSPTVVLETESGNSGSSTTFTVDTGSVQDGEGSIIVVSRDGGSGTVTFSDGYTESLDANDDDGFASAAVAYKQGGASEPSSITVTSTLSGEFTARAYRVSGHLSFDTQAPDIGFLTNEGNVTVHNPPSVNVTGGTKDILSIALLPFDTHNVSVSIFPSGYTNTGMTVSGASGSQCSLAFARRALSAVSLEDPGSFTLSGTRRGIPITLLIQEDAASGSTITANVAEAGDTTTAALEVAVIVTANQAEAGDSTAAAITVGGLSQITANTTEVGDSATADLNNIVGIAANQNEAGDSTSATISNIVSITANQAEAGDTTSAALDVAVSITASQNEAGDTTNANLNNIVSISANVAEAGDTTAASLIIGGLSQITANINEAGDTTTAALNNIVSITANVAEAGDTTAATVSTGGALVAATAEIDIFPAYEGQSSIIPAYTAMANII